MIHIFFGCLLSILFSKTDIEAMILFDCLGFYGATSMREKEINQMETHSGGCEEMQVSQLHYIY